MTQARLAWSYLRKITQFIKLGQGACTLFKEKTIKYYFGRYHSIAFLHYSSSSLTLLLHTTPMETAYVKFHNGAIQLLMDRNPGHVINYPCSWALRQKGQGLNGCTPQMEVDGLPPSNLFNY